MYNSGNFLELIGYFISVAGPCREPLMSYVIISVNMSTGRFSRRSSSVSKQTRASGSIRRPLTSNRNARRAASIWVSDHYILTYDIAVLILIRIFLLSF